MSLWMCPKCGAFYGQIDTCPKCHEKLEIVTMPGSHSDKLKTKVNNG